MYEASEVGTFTVEGLLTRKGTIKEGLPVNKTLRKTMFMLRIINKHGLL